MNADAEAARARVRVDRIASKRDRKKMVRRPADAARISSRDAVQRSLGPDIDPFLVGCRGGVSRGLEIKNINHFYVIPDPGERISTTST